MGFCLKRGLFPRAAPLSGDNNNIMSTNQIKLKKQ